MLFCCPKAQSSTSKHTNSQARAHIGEKDRREFSMTRAVPLLAKLLGWRDDSNLQTGTPFSPIQSWIEISRPIRLKLSLVGGRHVAPTKFLSETHTFHWPHESLASDSSPETPVSLKRELWNHWQLLHFLPSFFSFCVDVALPRGRYLLLSVWPMQDLFNGEANEKKSKARIPRLLA